MALKDNWVDKVDGVDIISAKDTNDMARAIIDVEKELTILSSDFQPNAVVRRDAAGHVIVPDLKENSPIDAAINKKDMQKLDTSLTNKINAKGEEVKAYTDEQITEAKQYSDDKLAPVANRVSALENTLLTLERDTSVAYAKAVPAKSYPKAFFNSIGGMTYRKVADNLFPCPAEGITRIVEPMIGFDEVYLPAGTYSYSVDATYEYEEEDRFSYLGFMSNPDNASDPMGYVELSTPFTLTETTKVYLIGIKDGALVGGNVTVKVMLNSGSTVKAFSAYFPPYLEDTKVTEVISHGANMFDIENAEIIGDTRYFNLTKTDKSIRLTTNRNLTNSWSYTRLRLSAKFPSIYVAATVNINGTQTQGCINVTLYDAATNKKINNVSIIKYPKNGERGSVYLNIPEQYRNDNYYALLLFYSAAGENCNVGDYIEYSDIIISTAEVPYTPYREPIRYPIPEAIQAQMSGKGVNGYADTVDFVNGKVDGKMHTIVLTGKEDFTVHSASSGYKRYRIKPSEGFGVEFKSIVEKAPIVCNFYKTESANGNYNLITSVCVNSTKEIFFYDERFNTSDIAPFKAFLAECYASGNPVTITYALAEPTETDLAASFDKKIDVFAGGYLEFKNDKGNAVPSDIAFITSK